MNLFDASALLCLLRNERGADVVKQELHRAGGFCSAVNWSETAQKYIAAGQSWPRSRSLLLSYGLDVVPVLAVDAEVAARMWREQSALSLADRLCLATAQRLQAVVWTADTAWGSSDTVRQIR